MKIGIDFEKLRNLNSGLGQYAWHLAKEFAQQGSAEFSYYGPNNVTKQFNDSVNCIEWKRAHQFLSVPFKGDVWHSTHQEAKYLPKRATKKILTIHDLNFLQKYSGLKQKAHISALQKRVSLFDGVTFISKYTQETCNQVINLKHAEQKVIYNGLTIDKTITPEKPDYNFSRPFLFSIGIFSEKKNFHSIIDALNHLPEFDLVLAGNHQTTYGQLIKSKIQKKGLSGRVHLLGEIKESEKYWLYQNCAAFVFPSLAEGFGLPLIESLYFKRPTVISNKTSLPEIANGFAFELSGFEPEKFAQSIYMAIRDFSPKKAEDAKTHSQSFSWKNTAEQYMQFYRKILEK